MEAWWRISAISAVRFGFSVILCVRPSSQFAHYINLCYHYYIKKECKILYEVLRQLLLSLFSRVGIFRTENSVRYRCGRGFCRFGMRSIGKIPLEHMDSQKNVASLGLTNHAIWIKIQKEVNKLNKNSKHINSGQRYI